MSMKQQFFDSECDLYRHFDGDGNLLYVGIAGNTLDRLADHKQISHWYYLIKSVTIERFATRKAAMSAEKRAIKKEHPKFNIMHSLTQSEKSQDDLPVDLPEATKPESPEFKRDPTTWRFVDAAGGNPLTPDDVFAIEITDGELRSRHKWVWTIPGIVGHSIAELPP